MVIELVESLELSLSHSRSSSCRTNHVFFGVLLHVNDQTDQYVRTFTENNINGRVLLNCNLDDLKKFSGMSFGDWELFRLAVLALRERELRPTPSPQSLVSAPAPHAGANAPFLDVDFDFGRISRSSSLRSTSFPVASAGNTLLFPPVANFDNSKNLS